MAEQDDAQTRVPAYILAGGQSSRFGSDKARATVQGSPLLQRVAEAAAPVASSITVIAGAPEKYADLGFRTIVDIEPGLGPLGGLFTALSDDAGGDWLLLLACDLGGVQTDWLARLVAATCNDADVILFDTPRPEPLIALYHPRLLPHARAELDAGQRAMHRFLKTCRCKTIPVPGDWQRYRNVNRPEDLGAVTDT